MVTADGICSGLGADNKSQRCHMLVYRCEHDIWDMWRSLASCFDKKLLIQEVSSLFFSHHFISWYGPWAVISPTGTPAVLVKSSLQLSMHIRSLVEGSGGIAGGWKTACVWQWLIPLLPISRHADPSIHERGRSHYHLWHWLISRIIKELGMLKFKLGCPQRH